MRRLQDVNICSALCFGQILRIHAPETPYSDADLTTMFGWFTVILRRLEHPTDPNFGVCYSVLDNAAQVICHPQPEERGCMEWQVARSRERVRVGG